MIICIFTAKSRHLHYSSKQPFSAGLLSPFWTEVTTFVTAIRDLFQHFKTMEEFSDNIYVSIVPIMTFLYSIPVFHTLSPSYGI